MKVLIREELSVKASPIHGWGVFAGRDIPSGKLIEQCHVLVNTRFEEFEEFEEFEQFVDYSFNLKLKNNVAATGLPLGFGSIYNHSQTPNAKFEYDVQNNILIFSTTQTIKQGEEIFVYYGDDWFDSRNTQPIQASIWFRIKSAYKRNFRMLLVVTALILSIMLLQDLSSSFILGN